MLLLLKIRLTRFIVKVKRLIMRKLIKMKYLCLHSSSFFKIRNWRCDQDLLLFSGTIFIPTVSYSAPAVGVSPVSIVHISLASIKNQTSNTEHSTHHLHHQQQKYNVAEITQSGQSCITFLDLRLPANNLLIDVVGGGGEAGVLIGIYFYRVNMYLNKEIYF